MKFKQFNFFHLQPVSQCPSSFLSNIDPCLPLAERMSLTVHKRVTFHDICKLLLCSFFVMKTNKILLQFTQLFVIQKSSVIVLVLYLCFVVFCILIPKNNYIIYTYIQQLMNKSRCKQTIGGPSVWSGHLFRWPKQIRPLALCWFFLGYFFILIILFYTLCKQYPQPFCTISTECQVLKCREASRFNVIF